MHGSMLPKYRGRAPVNWAIIHGETEAGATLHYMGDKPDNGDIVAQTAVPILPDDVAAEVFVKVTVAAELTLERTLPALLSGTAPRIRQDQAASSYFGGRKPEDGVIDWSKSATAIHNLVRAVAPLPVTAKIRIGWDADSVNAPRVARILEDTGILAVAVHGRTRAQGYSGEADWKVIGEVVEAVSIPVIGNGDLTSGADVIRRRAETGIAGAMIGRAAMSAPWIFGQVKHYFATGENLPSPSLSEKWELIQRHCQLAAEEWGGEDQAMRSMRARLMAYSRGFPNSKALREKFQHVSSLAEIDGIAADHLALDLQPALQ
jgi:hypothetical protein